MEPQVSVQMALRNKIGEADIYKWSAQTGYKAVGIPKGLSKMKGVVGVLLVFVILD